MLIIQDQKHFNLVVGHTIEEEVNSLASLLEKLEYLAEYSDEPTECVLSQDSCSEWGFDFAVYRTLNGARDPEPWFNGGLIEHGNEWGVHT